MNSGTQPFHVGTRPGKLRNMAELDDLRKAAAAHRDTITAEAEARAARDAAILTAHGANYPSDQIIDASGLSGAGYWKVLERHGAPKRPKHRPTEDTQ